MLSTMTSKLVKVKIGFSNEWKDAIEALANFSSSLEQLEVSYAKFIRQDIQYAKMKHLSIVLKRVLPVIPLIRAYPNLRRLKLTVGG